ncbi:hypothetical protein BGY98DRAFT_1054065 [Russula aff. rugulosa BPL654]|nr:hypothetical protein BGY98DRAFT_1054065 [Russula aff. rugulosa BPL654]
MPTINRMRFVCTPLTSTYYSPSGHYFPGSLMGFTAIPSMMIRTILGGTGVDKATQLQLTITFMMAASNTLSCIVAQHIRRNCIDTRPHVIWRAFNSVILVVINIVGYIWNLTMNCVKHFLQRRARHSALLNGSGSGDMILGFWPEPPVL